MPIKRKVTVTMTDDQEQKHPVEFIVSDAWSPYELWAAKPENKGKTKEDYVNSLKGSQGEDLVSIDTAVAIVEDDEDAPAE